MMEYKGYLATSEYDDEAEIFHGEVVNTRAVITFQGVSVEKLHLEMAESIEDYLAWCKERDKEPEKRAVGLPSREAAVPAEARPAAQTDRPRRRRAG